MLSLLLLQAAVPMLGALDRQALPARGCAAYLWNPTDRSFAAMAGADPANLRVKLDSKVVDLPRVAQVGQGGYGLATTTSYQAGPLAATLTMTVAARDDLTAGAMVPQATLTLRRPGSDELVQPLAGLIGCATNP
ncbi:hypothetical protein [Sphingomonas rubra]|uniref:Uncharacterized protein n=1 Tax=Sphingomonas rubra TaxID=634430 RepID=A0A1I5PRZ4_9SPHN|nr:hypothetical protein [Sphingomonas rubra]SFP36773.1 hypothetical protein SAMN04488241_101189 [Sphingomonas rubra]